MEVTTHNTPEGTIATTVNTEDRTIISIISPGGAVHTIEIDKHNVAKPADRCIVVMENDKRKTTGPILRNSGTMIFDDRAEAEEAAREMRETLGLYGYHYFVQPVCHLADLEKIAARKGYEYIGGGE